MFTRSQSPLATPILAGLLCWLTCAGLHAAQYRYSQSGNTESKTTPEHLKQVSNELAVNVLRRDPLEGGLNLDWLHTYTQLKQEQFEPLHNGHLHYTRMQWLYADADPLSWRIQWSLGLAMSSNRFKSLRPAADALVLEGTLWRNYPIRENTFLVAGLQANYLFHRYRLLPEIGLRWTGQAQTVTLSSQALGWSFVWNRQHRLEVKARRFGRKWFAEDNDTGIENEVYWRGIEANLGYQWLSRDHWRFGLSLGMMQTRTLRFEDRQAGSTSLAFESTPHITVSIYHRR